MNLPDPPPLPFLHSDGTIRRWTEFHEWAMCNDTTWHDVHRLKDYAQTSEVDALRLLAAHLLTQATHYRKQVVELHSKIARPVIVTGPEQS